MMEKGSDATGDKGNLASTSSHSNSDAPPLLSNVQEDQGDSWWGTWGQGWIDKVKEKSASTLEMVKKDLNEFVDVIQGDTSVAINETAEKLDDQVKKSEDKGESCNTLLGGLNTAELVTQGVKGFSQVLHSMSELMAVQEPDDTNEEFITLSEGSFSLQSYNRKQEKLQILQTDPGTYCIEPEGSFNDWLEVFSLDEHKEDMSDLLTQNPAVRAIYSRLVPNVISHTTFWQRYYYKVFLLESEERKREELYARADKGANDGNEDDEDGGWGDDDDDDDIEVIKSGIVSTSPALADATDVNKTPTKVESDKTELITDDLNTMKSPPVQSMRDDDHLTEANVNIVDSTHKETNIQEIETKPNDIVNEGMSAMEEFCETIKDDNGMLKDIKPIDSKTEEENDKKNFLSVNLLDKDSDKPETSETASISSWVSIDDGMKVKKIKGDQVVKNETRPLSDGSSSNSSGVLINKSDADILDDEDDDFDIDLDDVDGDDEELAKLVQDIKNKSATGDLQDDDDWENWE